jgi:hypothetical protein
VLEEDRQPAVHCFEIEGVDSEHRPSVAPTSRGTPWHRPCARPPRFPGADHTGVVKHGGAAVEAGWYGHDRRTCAGSRMNQPLRGS